MNKTLAIIGLGHLGQQMAHYAITDGHYQKVVFFDDFSEQKQINGFEVLGTFEAIFPSFEQKKFDEILIGIGYKHLKVRQSMFEDLKGKIPFGKIVHSTAWVDPTAQIQQGCVVYPGCIIDLQVVVSENSILNVGSSVSHDSTIGKHCFLSPRVAIAGFVTIGDLCILGINTTVIDNISITDGTQIGGGSVVIKNIETAGLYVGNPARMVRPA